MLSNLQKLLNWITVEEDTRNNTITISGIPSNILATSIEKLWKGSRVTKHMFIKLSSSKIVFHSFFALEVAYIFENLSARGKQLQLRKTSKSILDALYENTWLTNVRYGQYEEIFDRRQLSLFDKKPLDHQSQFFGSYEKNTQLYRLNGYMLAAPPGAGKTLTSLMVSEMVHADRVIIVCMKNAISDPWIKSLYEEYSSANKQENYWTSADREDPPRNKRFYIVHYQAIDLLFNITRTLSREKVVVILDESHHMNEITAKRTQDFIKLCHDTNAEHVLWVSGTPLKAIGAEMIPFLYTIDPYFNVDDVPERFKKIFGIGSDRAASLLSHRIGISSHRVDKSEVVPGEPIHETIDVSFKGSERYTLKEVSKEMEAFVKDRLKYYEEHRNHYKQVFDRGIDEYRNIIGNNKQANAELNEYLSLVRLIGKSKNYGQLKEQMKRANEIERGTIIPSLPEHMRKTFREAAVVVKYVELKVRGECLGQVFGKRREQMSRDIAKNANLPYLVSIQQKKSLIFSNHVSVVTQTQELFENENFEPIAVHGGTTSHFEEMMTSFRKDPKTNPAIATLKTLSTAIPITIANAVFFIDQPYREYQRNQAISRVHRLGQDAQVYVYFFMLDTGEEPNLASRSADIIEWSREQVNRLMGMDEESFDVAEQVSMESMGYDEQHQPLPASLRW